MSVSGRKIVAVVVSALLLAMTPACAKQGEGERCDREANGDADCEAPLVCMDFSPNAPSQTKIQRCCPGTGLSSDRRCDRSSIAASVGGTGGSATSSAGRGGSATSSAGTGGTTTTPEDDSDENGAGGASAGAGGSEE